MAAQLHIPSANESLIQLREVYKAYQTDAGGFMALKGINLEIGHGEFVAVIGKSGCGKSTLINMITGIDRPTSGEVWVAGEPIHRLSENQIARWRGKHLGVIFQFFQLLPGLSVLQNVMLPLDLRGGYDAAMSRNRAMELLELMGVADHAHKKPSEISGGQQQRVAIARSLIIDPGVLVADEPTGSLDSATSESIFQIFDRLIKEQRTTILIVTHDAEQAKRVQRTILLTDGEIVNEWVVKALPGLSHQDMLKVTHELEPLEFLPGNMIVEQDAVPDRFYIVTEGVANVYLHRPDGGEVFVDALGPGEFFGEMALLRNSLRAASVSASLDGPVKLVSLDEEGFDKLLAETPAFRDALEATTTTRAQTLRIAES